jgi:hypothetical protein
MVVTTQIFHANKKQTCDKSDLRSIRGLAHTIKKTSYGLVVVMQQDSTFLLPSKSRPSVAHASWLGTVKITKRNQSMAHWRLCECHLKCCARPEVVIKSASKHRPSAAEVKLNVADAPIESRHQLYGLLRPYNCAMAPNLHLESFGRRVITITGAACAATSFGAVSIDWPGLGWGAGGPYLKQ